MHRTSIALILAAAAALPLGGCLVTSSSTTDESGARISSASLDQIVLGETTETWLRATLGEPDACTTTGGCATTEVCTATEAAATAPETRVLRYDHSVTRSSGGTVFLIFAGKSKSSRVTRTFFEIENGVVTRYWIER